MLAEAFVCVCVMAAVKSLSNNSNIQFNLALAFLKCLFLIPIVIFFVLGIMSDFVSYHRHFGYYETLDLI